MRTLNIPPTTDTCPLSGELVDLSIDLITDPERAQYLRAHITECLSCKEAWRLMQEPVEEVDPASLDAEVERLKRTSPEFREKCQRGIARFTNRLQAN